MSRSAGAVAILLALLAACGRSSAPPAPEEARQCLATLDRLGVRYALEAAPASTGACAVETPVRVTAASLDWNQPAVVNCRFALQLEAFTRETIEPAALAHFGRRAVVLRHFGAYSCRRESGGNHRWSQHASGNAIDIAGFTLADGTVISVEHDWRKTGPKRDFLRDIAQRACADFSVVLTPDSDAEHYNHLHLDAGPYRLCGR
jgi:hypothetical protein